MTTGSNNIDISSPGVTGDRGQIHLDTQGVQQAVFIAGVNATTVSGTSSPVVVDSHGQLGTASSGGPATQPLAAAAALMRPPLSHDVIVAVPHIPGSAIDEDLG